MNPISLLNLISSAIYISLGIYCYNSGKHEPESKISRLFLILCLCFSIWGFSFAFMHSASSKNEIEVWYNISSIGWCMFSGFVIHLILLMTGRESILKRKWVYFAIYLPGIVFTIKEFTGNLYALDFIRINYGYSEIPDVAGIWFWLFVIHQTVCELLGLYLLFIWGKRSHIKRERKQADIFITTSGISLILAFTSDIILPAMNIFILPALSPVFILIWGYGLWYSISRYKFISLNRSFSSDEIASRMNDLFFILDLEGNIVKVNHQVIEFLGFDERNILKTSFQNILTNKETLIKKIHSMTESNVLRFENINEFNTAKNESIPVKISGSLLLDKFGDPIGIVIIAIDLRDKFQLQLEIKERALSMAALRESEGKYRTLLQTNNVGYYESDLYGNFTFCNDVLESFTGYTREELIGMNYTKIMSAEMSGEVFKTYHRVFKKEIAYGSTNHEILRKDGTTGYFETTISLITDKAGNPSGFRVIGIDITKRKIFEEALRKSEELYRLVMENINDAVFICRLDGHLKYMSPSMIRIAGYTVDEMLDVHYLHFVRSDYRKRELDLYIKQVQDKIEVTEHEYPFISKNGRSIWVGQIVRMVKNNLDEIEFFGVLRDISERKGAEEALKRSEEKYRHLIENANEIIYKADWRGNFIYSNPAFQKKFGYTDEEIRKLNYIDLMLPDNRDNEFAFYSGQLKNKIDESYRELPVLTKSGKILWIEQSVKSIKDQNGRIVEFDSIVHDITDRKTAEDSLRKSEMLYQQLMENVSDCVFICKQDGHFKYFNPTITRVAGYSQNDLIGKHFLTIVHPDYREQQKNFYLKQVRENIEITYYEFPIIMKNGGTIWAGQTVRMIRNYEGEIEFYGITRDISALKKAEDARRDLEDAKTRFFANISHEIRTPLTLMLGPIESVLQGNYDGELDSGYFENLHRNTLRLLTLVNNLLDFSKIDAGRMSMRVIEGDIVSFARSYITSMESVGKTRKIDMRFNSSAESIMLYFDPERLDKVLMNLLSNALKFTGTGGEITINVSEDNDNCRITVADTGEGIPEKSLSSIFERFNQADTASTRRHQGTGIGLALAKELTELHGGSIKVESRYIENHPDNHGSIFIVEIPKGIAHFENKANVKFAEKSNLDNYVKDYRLIGISEIESSESGKTVSDSCSDINESDPSSNEKTILIIDDNDDMRNFLYKLLHKQYRIISAVNGQEGIKCARKLRPDLIVTDVMMPVMDGFEMTSIIKNDEYLKTTPVIMLTADTELMNKVAGLENGADDYLHKPFNSIELKTRISSLMKNHEYQQIISRRNQDIESELDVARMLQQRLLPVSIPEVSGYHLNALYVSMDKVGGDFYDMEKRDGSLDIFIADVCGHGLPGAFLATVTKISFDNITTRTTPDKVLCLLNNVIHRYTVNSNFVTAFYATIDINTGVMRYSSAGHVTPLLYRKKNDEFIELKAQGTLLGIFRNLKFEEKIIQLESSDRVVFYTDGITECTNPEGEMFDEASLQKSIREHAGKTAGEFKHEVMKELEAFKGEKTFDDDITMVVLDVL